MTSHELAKWLLVFPDKEIYSWCPDGEDWFPVTGFTSGETVKLYNDSDEECED